MVEVIGPDPQFVKEVVCRGCSTRLRYTNKDLEKIYSFDYGGGGDTYYWLKCPACNKDFTVQPI